MISTFNLDKLKKLLKDFYTITQIRITVFNDSFQELVAYPEERSSFCRLLRQDPAACAACDASDRRACETASRRSSTYIYRCHAGLTEAITPIYMGNIPVGYLFFGQAFSYPDHDNGLARIRECCQDYQVDLDRLLSACNSQPLILDEVICSASHIMQAVASYLCLERMVSLRQKDLPIQIDEYIQEHLAEDLSAPRLCSRFHIGKTHLYEISRQNYGMGIGEHIRALRMERARQLLTEHPELPIGDVAELCGFSDYNYFITAFRREVGASPRRYRKEREGLA